MKDGLLERIRNVGHWRVNVRPLSRFAEPPSLQQCFDVVEKSRVSIRGWDYPHISHRNDEQGGTSRAGDYVENWCDWHTQLEFWRMYKSRQFLSYGALNEDLDPGYHNKPAGRFLDILDAIYSVTEFFEFSLRLFQAGFHPEGSEIVISLLNTKGRQLYVGPGRMPFLDARRTDAEKLEFTQAMKPAQWADGSTTPARAVLLELFDHFGWNPEAGQIKADQDMFVLRRF